MRCVLHHAQLTALALLAGLCLVLCSPTTYSVSNTIHDMARRDDTTQTLEARGDCRPPTLDNTTLAFSSPWTKDEYPISLKGYYNFRQDYLCYDVYSLVTIKWLSPRLLHLEDDDFKQNKTSSGIINRVRDWRARINCTLSDDLFNGGTYGEEQWEGKWVRFVLCMVEGRLDGRNAGLYNFVGEGIDVSDLHPKNETMQGNGTTGESHFSDETAGRALSGGFRGNNSVPITS